MQGGLIYKEYYCGANSDVLLSLSMEELQQKFGTIKKLVYCQPQYVRPTHTWSAIPTPIFYISTNSIYGFHNIGVEGDTFEVTWVVVFY